MRWLIFALLFCSCLPAQQATIAGLEIRGLAIDAVTRQPMAGVHITLRAGSALGIEREDAETYGAISRPDGRFSIAELKPGVYYLVAQHNGYVQLPGKNPASATITLKPGELVQDVTVGLTQHAVIIGHVLDEYGDPVRYVQVSAEAVVPGNVRSFGNMGARTDERGQFRIPLAPGKYYVKALADSRPQTAMGSPEIRSDGAVPPVYAATYYPAAASGDQATAIELAPGQSTSGIDIHLVPKRGVTVRGRVTGMQAGTVPSAYIMVSPVGSSPGYFGFIRPYFAEPDGTFAIAGLTPGKYRLIARLPVADGPDMQSASVEVDAESDESNVVLALAHGETLAGTVEFEGESAKPGVSGKLSVRLNPEIQFGGNKGADVGDDGTFHADGIFPGKLHVSVMPLPENAYVKSIKAGAAEAQEGLVDLSRGVAGAEIHITLSRKGGRVEGKVLGEDGQPFAGAALVMLSEAAKLTDAVDDKGVKMLESGEKFSYAGLHPGKYRIMAVEPGQFMGGLQAPEALKALLAHAEEIEIHEGDRIAKDLKIIAAESASAKQ